MNAKIAPSSPQLAQEINLSAVQASSAKLTVAQLVSKFPAFMKLEWPSLCLIKPAVGSYQRQVNPF